MLHWTILGKSSVAPSAKHSAYFWDLTAIAPLTAYSASRTLGLMLLTSRAGVFAIFSIKPSVDQIQAISSGSLICKMYILWYFKESSIANWKTYRYDTLWKHWQGHVRVILQPWSIRSWPQIVRPQIGDPIGSTAVGVPWPCTGVRTPPGMDRPAAGRLQGIYQDSKILKFNNGSIVFW